MSASPHFRGGRAGIGLILFLVAGSVVIGCGKKGVPAPQGGSDVPPSKVNLKRGVDVAQVEQRSIVSAVEAVGTLEGEAMVQIPAGVAGIVEEVDFREGAIVDPAEQKPLIKIDQAKYRALSQIAEALEREADANAKSAEDAYRRAKASRDRDPNSITLEELTKRLQDSIAAQARHVAAQEQRKVAQINLTRSQVMPPIRGQINQKLVAKGANVKEDTVIATMLDVSRIRLVGYVPESAAPLVRQRIKARPTTAVARELAAGLAGHGSGPGLWNTTISRFLVEAGEIPSGFDPEFVLQPMPHRLLRAGIFYMSTTGDPSTHMFEFKAEIDRRNVDFSQFSPGYSAKIRIPVQTTAQAITIPEEAVRATERGFLVFVPEKNKQGEWVARPRRVEIGVRSPGWVEIRQGLSVGQWIVRRGAEALEDGTPLRLPPDQESRMAGK